MFCWHSTNLEHMFFDPGQGIVKVSRYSKEANYYGIYYEFKKKVSHSPLIGVGATILVFNNKIELKEETNINVYDLELITVLSGKDYYFKYPNEDELDCVIALYKVSNYEGESNINDEESKELKFFSLDNLPELESRANAIIDKIKSGLIKL